MTKLMVSVTICRIGVNTYSNVTGVNEQMKCLLPVPGGAGLQILLSVRRSVDPPFPKTPPRVAPIRAKIGGDVQRGRGMKAVKTLYEKVAPVLRKKITNVLFP